MYLPDLRHVLFAFQKGWGFLLEMILLDVVCEIVIRGHSREVMSVFLMHLN